MSQHYYTTFDVAELLQISDDQVRKLITLGELATISLAMPGSKRRCVRISQQQFDDFIESRTVEAANASSKPASVETQLPPITRYV